MQAAHDVKCDGMQAELLPNAVAPSSECKENMLGLTMGPPYDCRSGIRRIVVTAWQYNYNKTMLTTIFISI